MDDVSLAVQGCRNFNEEPNALLWSPRTAGTYDRLKDTTNQPLRPPESYANLQKHVTKQLPDNLGGGANESIALVGNATLVQRGVGDALRARAFTLVMSATFASLGAGMIAAGPLTDGVGPRTAWAVAAGLMLAGTGLAAGLTRGLARGAAGSASQQAA